jgi:hypothetical protein
MATILREIKNQIHGELIQRLDLKRMTVSRIRHRRAAAEGPRNIRTIIAEVRRNQKLPAGIDPARWKRNHDEPCASGRWKTSWPMKHHRNHG